MQPIHENQYGFIKSRIIHDFLAWEYEYLHRCHKSKREREREMFILKFDFEKAYHSFILGVLGHKGFPPKCYHCIMHILSSTFSFVLLNGVPSSLIRCKRGVGRWTFCPLLYLFWLLNFCKPLSMTQCFKVTSPGLCLYFAPMATPISCGS
jgi:hypothetical protein